MLCIATMGVAVPLSFHSIESSIPFAVLFPVVFLKPLLADSLAGERERKTLESLLSTPICGKRIVWGKALFGWLFATIFFALTAVCVAVTCLLAGYAQDIAIWQWFSIAFMPILSFAVISVAGAYASVRSADSHIASRKLSGVAYPLGLLLIVTLTVVMASDSVTALFMCAALALAYLYVMAIYMVRVLRMRQADFFENVKMKKPGKAQSIRVPRTAPKSQFGIVFGHELRYLMTLKSLFLSPFGLLPLCFAPMAVACLPKLYGGEIDLNYAVILTALAMPRTPMNLVAYSVGGEKTYRTGESLLSTPLMIKPLFLAKSTVAVLVSLITLFLSSILTLAGANHIGKLAESGAVYMYTASQLVLLFPVGIMSSVTMVFVTGILSANMKTPRQGLYISSLLTLAFVIPVLAIVYLGHSELIWPVIYFAALFLGNAFCVRAISGKVSRPLIMSRL